MSRNEAPHGMLGLIRRKFLIYSFPYLHAGCMALDLSMMLDIPRDKSKLANARSKEPETWIVIPVSSASRLLLLCNVPCFRAGEADEAS